MDEDLVAAVHSQSEKYLGTRVLNLLYRMRCRSWEDVKRFSERYSEDELLRMKDVGKQTIRRLKEVLSQSGLKLSEPPLSITTA